MAAIHAFYKSGKPTTVYSYRAHILKVYGETTGTFLDIVDTPGDFLSKILSGKHPKTSVQICRNRHFSVKTSQSCADCHYLDEKLLFVSNMQVQNFHVSKLSEYVQTVFLNTECEKCRMDTLETEYNEDGFGKFLAIDVEDYNVPVFLEHIPTSIKIWDGLEYILSGVLNVSTSKNTKKNDYTAFCRTSDGRWYERDNTVKPKSSCLKSSPRIELAMIFYVLSS